MLQPDSEIGLIIPSFEKAFKDLKTRYLNRYRYRRDFGKPAIFEDHAYTK